MRAMTPHEVKRHIRNKWAWTNHQDEQDSDRASCRSPFFRAGVRYFPHDPSRKGTYNAYYEVFMIDDGKILLTDCPSGDWAFLTAQQYSVVSGANDEIQE